MPLSAGDKLGPYEIVAPLGAGGMGEVYQARDTRLKRDVAIKVLPAALAHDPERMARFEREARLLASLDHPNIGAIYGLEENGGTRALVLALIEGPTLADRIAAGFIPLEETLHLAQQMAEALEYAHDRGVIHRDLKPANVKITPEGTLKVLDFGLAKALADEADPASGSPTNSPTISPTLTMQATQAGVILGTAAYMAPEQAKGRPVDRRADIWAFGVVLFEMLTGEPLFIGDSIAEVMAAAIKDDPKLDRLPRSTPPAVRRLIERCLIKEPRQRLRDIGEARIALQNLSHEPEIPAGTATRAAPGKLPWIVAGLMTALAAVALWAPGRPQTPADRPLMRLDLDLGPDVSLPASSPGGSDIAISPDGMRLAYVSGTPQRLFVRRLDQPNATELHATEEADKPFFSQDGQWVGFTVRGKLSKISVDGGAVVALGDIASFGGASWDENGSIVVSEAPEKGLLRIPPGGGQPEIIEKLNAGETALNQPQILPGGKAILFSAVVAPFRDRNMVEVLTLADGHRKIVARGGVSARYLPTSGRMGHLVYLNGATLFAVPFDPAKLEARGTPVPVLDDVANYSGTGSGEYDVSPAPSGHGTFVYRRAVGGAAAGLSALAWIDAAGKQEPLRAKPAIYYDPALSPDGKRIALSVRKDEGMDIWMYDPQRDAATRLTFGGTVNRFPVWSPNGQYVVFDSRGQGIFQTRADGSSQPQVLMESKDTLVPWSFAPDGKRLAYTNSVARTPQIWTLPLEDQGGRWKAGKPEQFLKSSFADFNPAISPDGHWLAYTSYEAGTAEVYVRAFPTPSSGPGGRWQISNSGGSSPHWSPNSHDLFYRSSGDQIMAVSYSAKGEAFVPDKPRVWIPRLGGRWWDLAPDGKRVLVVTPAGSAEAPKQEHDVVFLINFFDELRRRVPLGK